ncbi:hypothetical protein V1278_004194 [Bradyrhizobium sp. AZCC 1577]
MRQQGKWIGQIAPPNRLLVQREDVGFGPLRYRRYQAFEIGLRCACGEIAIEQRHVESGMLAAHETGAARAISVPECERKQRQRTAFRVVGNHDEGNEAFARADLPLPGAEEVEPLIRREEGLPTFQVAPDGFGRGEVLDDVDAGDTARLRPPICIRRPAFNRGSHGHRRARVI